MSLTIASLFAFLIGRLLQSTGIVATDESISNFVAVAIQIIGAIGIYWGRFRRGDLNLFGGRIKD